MWAFAPVTRRVLTLPSASFRQESSQTLCNYPLLLTGIKQERQADGMNMEISSALIQSRTHTQLAHLLFSHPNY